jgi:hypothetical protein
LGSSMNCVHSSKTETFCAQTRLKPPLAKAAAH